MITCYINFTWCKTHCENLWTWCKTICEKMFTGVSLSMLNLLHILRLSFHHFLHSYCQFFWRFYRTSSEIVEEIILFQTTILSHTVLHSPDKYSQATNVQTSDIGCNKQLEIGCHEHCSSAI